MKGSEKRQVRRAAARLSALGRVGSVAGRSDEDRLRESIQAVRNEDVYEAAARCEACQAVRQAIQKTSADATALCERHMTQAMGCLLK